MKPAVMIYLAVAALSAIPQASIAQDADNDVSRTVVVATRPDGPGAVIVEDRSMPNRDLTAKTGPLPDGAAVGIAGRVVAKNGFDLIISRRDGDVRARIAERYDATAHRYTGDVLGKVRVGDEVVVYGRLHRVPEDLIEVETEAVLDQTADKTYLTALGDERVQQSAGSGPVTLHYHTM